MTSKERVFKALNHESTDRVPLFYRDVPAVAERLLNELSLPNRDALLNHLNIDFRWVTLKYTGPELDAPALKTISAVAKQYGAKYYHHSCGSIRPLIPYLIDLGVDVIDPLQVQAMDMDPAELKAAFGEQVTFSGGIDEQQLLPNGTPEEVRDEVFRLCDIMAKHGGYFLGPTHNFQEDIPTENIVAMYQAGNEWQP